MRSVHRAQRSRSLSWLFLVALVIATVASCGKVGETAAASNEVTAATRAVKAALHRLMTEYPRLETELDPLRAAEPKRAATRIRAAVVPLFDDVAKSLEAAAAAEDRYVAVAGDHPAPSDVAAIEGIRKNAAIHHRQATSYADVRDGYTKEATLLDAGTIPPAQARAIIEARVARLQHLD